MNMLYEGLKQNSTIVIVPSTAVESMQLGGLAGLTALTMGIGQENKPKSPTPVIPVAPVPAALAEDGLTSTNGVGEVVGAGVSGR